MRRTIIGGVIIVLMVSGLACTSNPSVRHAESGPAKSQGHGPPPHAPAHGYRAKTHDGVELVFRSDLGVYVVVGASGYYFHDSAFYHQDSTGWVVAKHRDGPWKTISKSKLPPGLRSESKAKGKKKGKSPPRSTPV